MMREPDGDLLSPEIQPTIIGAGAFHCPVRNGKEWGRSAMAVRQGLCFAGLNPARRNCWEGMNFLGCEAHTSQASYSKPSQACSVEQAARL